LSLGICKRVFVNQGGHVFGVRTALPTTFSGFAFGRVSEHKVSIHY